MFFGKTVTLFMSNWQLFGLLVKNFINPSLADILLFMFHGYRSGPNIIKQLRSNKFNTKKDEH